MNKNLIIVSLCLIFLISMVSAIPLPHAFYGNVKYSNGENVEGMITAKIDESIVGSCDIIDGEYNLVVESEYGGLIYFYLEGENESVGTFLFDSFEVTELNFIIEIPESPPENETDSTSRSRRGSSSYQPNFELFCEPNWKCSGWNECENGLMTRQCYDSNHCDYAYNRPIEEIGCEMTSKALIKEEKNNWAFILFGIITPLILIIILIVIVSVKGRKK